MNLPKPLIRSAAVTIALGAVALTMVAGPAQSAEGCVVAPAPKGANQLSAAERAAGWKLLWDGKTSTGWRSAGRQDFPSKGWTMCGGALTITERGGGEATGPGDIITKARYSDFDLSFDFRIAPGANSGVKIFVQTNLSPIDKVTGKPVNVGSAIGMEFQVLDDLRHPDAKLGRDGNRTVGSLYDIIPAAKDKVVQPPGAWNHARILSKGNDVTYWLNGKETVHFTRGSEAFRAAVAQSKFKDISDFGEWSDGHILIQDHGNTASFTNIKIRDLRAAP